MSRLVRCYRSFGRTRDHFNIEVWFVFQDGYGVQLHSCLKCGQVHVVDFENPKWGDARLNLLASLKCHGCRQVFGDGLAPYPERFLAPDGTIGWCDPRSGIAPHSEGVLLAFPELLPDG